VFTLCCFKDQSQAISTLFEVLSLIEMLWNSMIAFELGMLGQREEVSEKLFKGVFRARALSYTKAWQGSIGKQDKKGRMGFYFRRVLQFHT
jgi:hypothetical protein